jgi:hypothetical protein
VSNGPVALFSAYRGFRSLSATLLLCLGLLTSAGGPLEELPVPTPPPDPQDLLNALQPNLPANWHMGQPYNYLGVPYVRVQIQDEWRGNPIAAAIAMCPDPENPIWHQTRVIALVMRHLRHDWPPYQCRP